MRRARRSTARTGLRVQARTIVHCVARWRTFGVARSCTVRHAMAQTGSRAAGWKQCELFDNTAVWVSVGSRTHARIRVRTHKSSHAEECARTHARTRISACTNACAQHACTNARAHAQMHAHKHAHALTCAYAHTHTHVQKPRAHACTCTLRWRRRCRLWWHCLWQMPYLPPVTRCGKVRSAQHRPSPACFALPSVCRWMPRMRRSHRFSSPSSMVRPSLLLPRTGGRLRLSHGTPRHATPCHGNHAGPFGGQRRLLLTVMR